MAKVIFTYNGNETIIQCNIDEKMKDICQRFAKKLQIEIDKIYFIYNGSKINEELNFNEQANEEDRKRNIMNVLVNDINDRKEEKIVKSKEVICPICKENILINIY